MEEQMKLMINMLKERIKHNLQIIKKNEEEVRSILNLPLSNERSELLQERFGENRKMLDENHDSLAIELQMINYMIKFKDVLKHQAKEIESSNFIENSNEYQDNNLEEQPINIESKILELTVNGAIPYNASHPNFNDNEFYDNLLEAYTQAENYEMCSQMLKMKSNK